MQAGLTNALGSMRAGANRSAEILRTGVIDAVPAGSLSGGVNGSLETRMVRDASGAVEQAVLRRPEQQNAQEVFLWDLARGLQREHLVAPAAMRGDLAAVKVVPGTTALEAGYANIDQLHGPLRAGYLQHTDDAVEAGLQARLDLEAIKLMDVLAGNADRHGGNLLVDAKATTPDVVEGIKGIDFGAMGRTGFDRLHPAAVGFMTEGGPRVQLHERTLDALRTGLTEDVLRGAHARMADSLRAGSNTPGTSREKALKNTLLERTVVQDRYLGHVLARRDEILRTGELRFTPIPDDWRRPLMIMPQNVVDAFRPELQVAAGGALAVAGAGASAWALTRDR